MKAIVLDGHALNPGDLSWRALEELVDLAVHPRTAADEILTRAAGAAIVLTNKTPLRENTLRELPELKYIGVLATGYDVVDSAAARALGIAVTNVPTYGTDSVAQFVFALLLELCHRVQRHSDSAAKEWAGAADWSYHLSPLVELAGKTFGVVGLGRIGRRAARIADSFGMKVIAADVAQGVPLRYEGFEWVTVDELFERADVVSLHCPLTADNRGLVNAARLARMKRGAFLVNTSRGPLVVEQDLADALAAGRLAGAALDVLPVEPPVAGSPLLGAPNCLITPHLAWATKEARGRLLDQAVENIAAFLAGRPVNVVNA
ncbi:MAG TPA: glycerate dehydrogenase [Solibacterales bacterium]|nr:glycerate dehydrogenase [Bryobacterales bacterium]